MLEAIAVRSPIFGNPCNGADLAISRFEPFTLSGILCLPISGDDGNNFVAGQQMINPTEDKPSHSFQNYGGISPRQRLLIS